jgi:hypothetical protein
MPCRNSTWTAHEVHWAGPRPPQVLSATRDLIPLQLMRCSPMPPLRSRRRRRNSPNRLAMPLRRTATAPSLTGTHSLPLLSRLPITTTWARLRRLHGLNAAAFRTHSLQLPGPSLHQAIQLWVNLISHPLACALLSLRPLQSRLPTLSLRFSRHTMLETIAGLR